MSAMVTAAAPAAAPGRVAVVALERVLGAVEELAGLDARDLPVSVVADVLARLEIASRRLAGVRAAVVAVVSADGLWAVEGARSMPVWLARTTASSVQAARAEHKVARAVREHLPVTGAALRGGLIGAEHAQLIARHATATPERVAALAHPQVGEVFLVEQAKVMPAGDFSRLVRRWAAAADPGGADAAYRDDAGREQVVLARTLDGWHLQGWLSAALGGVSDGLCRRGPRL